MDTRRPAHQNVAQEIPAAPRTGDSSGSGGGLLKKLLSILLVVVALLVIGWIGSKAYASLSADWGVKGKQYQAVFLTNGQVYFGKVAHVDGSYVQLKDIYYLQVQQSVQPKDAKDTSNQQVSLAKLGGELHGPEDTMFISRAQVLFWENLKGDGKVAQAISSYKSGNK